MNSLKVTFSNDDELQRLICETKELLHCNVELFRYPESLKKNDGFSWEDWNSQAAQIRKLNENVLKSIANKAGVYAIYTRSSSALSWKVKYIGQTKDDHSKGRINSHLVRRYKGTGAQIENVKVALESGQEIGFSFVEVSPKTLRHFVEAEIISSEKNLDWNIHGNTVEKDSLPVICDPTNCNFPGDKIGPDTLMLLPCCAKKLPGGTTWPTNSDVLRNLVPPDVYSKVLLNRETLRDVISGNDRYTTQKYYKNKILRRGEDFGFNTAQGKYLPAIERYVGNLYSAHHDFASVIKDNTNIDGKPRLLILSALYGPLHPLSPIQDYNLQMSDAPAKRNWKDSFVQFLESYVEVNSIKCVRMYFGTSTAYFEVGRKAVELLLQQKKLERAYQYDIKGGNSYHTPHNHGLLVFSALSDKGDLEFTRRVEVNVL